MKLTRSYIFHPNINVQVEENPPEFLNHKITRNSNETKAQLFSQRTPFPIHLSTKVPLLSIKGVITGKLNRSKK